MSPKAVAPMSAIGLQDMSNSASEWLLVRAAARFTAPSPPRVDNKEKRVSNGEVVSGK